MASRTANQPTFEITTSRQFTEWLSDQRVSLAFTTYQVGKVFWLGLQPNGRLEVFNRTFNRAMALYSSDQTLYLSTLYQIWRFENVLGDGEQYQGYDRLYVPQVAWMTGDIDVHDIEIDSTGKPIFVTSSFSCLATTSERYSFEVIYQPPFISKLAAEDRCHLNGVAMQDGEPRYVTAVSRSDVADGWRDHRQDGGIIVDVDSGEIVADKLSMPHSPRLYRDKLWVLNSGAGYFGYIDLERGAFEPVTFCPGYGRGLAFVGDYAIVGLSRPRGENRTFAGLDLEAELRRKNAEARCGIHIIDLRTGDVAHWVRISGIMDELYDITVTENVVRPMAIGLKSNEIHRIINLAP